MYVIARNFIILISPFCLAYGSKTQHLSGICLLLYLAELFAFGTLHPVWVRGLKSYLASLIAHGLPVAPRVGAWIEILKISADPWSNPSHPVWVRGLKSRYCCVNRYPLLVAPRVGAWIEIAINSASHLVGACRTPCGCVD